MYETYLRSECCRAEAVNSTDEEFSSTATFYRCVKCKRICDVEEVCVFCDGTGQIRIPAEQVWDGSKTIIRDEYFVKCTCKNKQYVETHD